MDTSGSPMFLDFEARVSPSKAPNPSVRPSIWNGSIVYQNTGQQLLSHARVKSIKAKPATFHLNQLTISSAKVSIFISERMTCGRYAD